MHKASILYFVGSEKQRCWSDCTDGQAVLQLCCLQFLATRLKMASISKIKILKIKILAENCSKF